MKKIFYTILLLVAVAVHPVGVSAQNAGQADGYDRLLERMTAAASRCDSLAKAVSLLRVEYAGLDDDAQRSAVGAEIVAAESEIIAAKKQYNALVAEVARQEIQNTRMPEVETPPTGGTAAEVAELAAVGGREYADLVKNAFFAEHLSPDDYRTLVDAQRSEEKSATLAGEYAEIYSHMVSLKDGYMAAEDENAANALMHRFNDADTKLAAAEDALECCWSALLDNKTYLYNLLMETNGHNAVLASSEQSAAETAYSVEESAGKYASDVLMSYGWWKRWLAGYELQIASALQLQPAQDSLRRVAVAVNPEDYAFAPIAVERRYFLEYEPIKVVKPSIYNSKNPVPQTKVYDNGTMFRIRIGIFINYPNMSALRGITPLSYMRLENGRKAYFVGGFKTAKEANDGVAYLKKLGFREPVVAMWRDGEYISDYNEWEKTRVHEYSIELSGVPSLPDEVRQHILSRHPSCTFTKVGDTFMAGKFTSRSEAERLAGEIVKINSGISSKIVDITKP